MSPIDQPTETADDRRRSLLARGRTALGVGAVALALVAAGCGSDDDGGSTTSAAGGSTTEQTEQTTTQTSGGDNGIADKSAEEILTAAQEAARAASSVRISGGDGDVSLDLGLVRGEGGTGSITQGGVEFELLALGDELYIRGSDEFYDQLGVAGTDALRGKWLKAGAGNAQMGDFTRFTDLETLLSQVLDPPSATFEKGGTEEVDGQPAVTLTDDDGVLFVATEGEPLPLRITPADGSAGEMTFSEWNEPIELTAPDADEVLDFDRLQRSAGS